MPEETKQIYGFKEVHDAIERLSATAQLILARISGYSISVSAADSEKIIQKVSERIKKKGVTSR